MKLFRLARPIDSVGVGAGCQSSMVPHEAPPSEPVNGQLVHRFGYPFQSGALREGTPGRVGNLFARVMINLGVDLHIVAQEDGWLAFSQCCAYTCKAQHLTVVPGFFDEFSERCSFRTFARVHPAFGETPLSLMGP